MYEIIKSVIESGRYELSDMLNKIDTIWLQGKIDELEKMELVELAQANAIPEHSNAPLQEQILKVVETVDNIKIVVAGLINDVGVIKKKLDESGIVVPEPEPEPQPEEFPEWEPYNGIPPVPYQIGSKVMHNGKKWESMVQDNIWEPGAFGVDERIWKEITE